MTFTMPGAGPILHYAEVVFPMYPGRVSPGKVLTTVDVANQGQLSATGLIPGIGDSGNARFAVRILLDHAKDVRLPAGTQGSAIWIATVESIASAKPTISVRAFSRQGAGRSEMLADIAPSVAGWPAAKPKIAEATRATATNPAQTKL